MSRRIATLLAAVAGAVALASPSLADGYVVQPGPVNGPWPPAASVMIVGAPTLYGDDGIMPAYPNMYPDPAWKLCQIEQGAHDRRYYHCGPYSYHPYGTNGYRPLGTYRPYRAVPTRGTVPSARIITIPGDR